jgi:hypothetical protein
MSLACLSIDSVYVTCVPPGSTGGVPFPTFSEIYVAALKALCEQDSGEVRHCQP